MKPLIIEDLGTVAYNEAFALQRLHVERRQSDDGDDTLFLLEHPHVITLGRNATTSSLIASDELLAHRGVARVETDRGGDVTYHGPGQLVGYPILSLEHGRRDIRRFVTDLEEVVMMTLAAFGIESRHDPVHRGVWTGHKKIASVGIRISRWVTSHGFALNVNTDLSYFSLIHPCGIAGCEMTTMSRELDRTVQMNDVKVTFARYFAEVFDRNGAWRAPREERLHA